MTTRPDDSFERASLSPVCGIDEAGRGPWAGPVVASAVILDLTNFPDGLNDSKKLTAAKRDALFDQIMACADVGVGIASVAEIDEINILQATFLAMRRATANLTTTPRFALIDGNRIPPDLLCDAQAIVKGDGRSVSIAAASIIAKVTRDRIMQKLASDFPGYGWEQNKGYGVKAHAAALDTLGVTEHHRKSFKPIKILLGK
ncbi:MAG: ribonuclease HII [Rhodobacteraceae bacterium]|nr:ribonuclease HII [Paracoccaceae bacterium]